MIGCSGSTSTSSATGPKMQHVVFIIKENRSFDEYFGQFPGANGTKFGTLSNGQTIPLGHTPDQTPHDVGHDWFSGIEVIDGGKMDLFDINYGGNLKGDLLAFTQMGQEDIPNYTRRNFPWLTTCSSRFTVPVFPTTCIQLQVSPTEW